MNIYTVIKMEKWQKKARRAIEKIHNAYENGTGTNLTKEEVEGLMLTSIGEEHD